MLGRRLVAIVVLGVLAAGIGAVVYLNVHKGLTWSGVFSTDGAFVLAAALALVALLTRLLKWAGGALPRSDTTVERAREDLALALSTTWAEEDRLRRINDPWPLNVCWKGPPAGNFEDIATVYRALPDRRLVVLGPAGAGKTALTIKLVRDLLRDRPAGDPVPVLLPASSWISGATLTGWIAQQLTRDYPGLAVQVKSATGDTIPLARTLAAEVLPVIDGLDELPEPYRAEMITEINARGSDHPLILTARYVEYTHATAGRPVARATVIELEPLSPGDVRAYLPDATEKPGGRWDPVFAQLDAGKPVTEVLTNPLMLWLARTVYERGDTDPSDLTGLTSRDEVETHLLTAFVPAVYPDSAQRARAMRWLGFLAARQERDASRDIAWWRLWRAEWGWSAVLTAIRVALYICVAWSALTLALTRLGYFRDGGYDHVRQLVLAGPLGRAVLPVTTWFPQHSKVDLDTALHSILALGLATWVLIAAPAGLLFGAIAFGAKPVVPRTAGFPAARLRNGVIGQCAAFGLVAFGWWRYQGQREPIAAIMSLWRTDLVLTWFGLIMVAWVIRNLTVPVTTTGNPGSLLRSTRETYLLKCAGDLVSVAAVWLWTGTVLASAYAAFVVAKFVIIGLLGASVVGVTGTWQQFHDARFRLWVRRRLPWRIMRFLADAHRRGVLRQSGATYQFRHILLQKQLAAGYSPWPPALARLLPARSPARTRLSRRADRDSITVTPDSVAGTIPPRSAIDSLRQAVAGRLPATALVVALAIAGLIGLAGWYFSVAGLALAATVLVLLARGRLRHYRAGLAVAPHTWSVRMTGTDLTITRNDEACSLPLTDVSSVAVAPVRTSTGEVTEWIALQARVRSGARTPAWLLPAPAHNRSVPLVWLTTRPITFSFTVPSRMRSILRWFPDEVLSTPLRAQKHAAATSFRTEFFLAPADIPWLSGVAAPAAAGVALVVSGEAVLGVFCLMWCTGAFIYSLFLQARNIATRSLPAGKWSVRVSPAGIDTEVNGTVTHLDEADVAGIEYRSMRGRRMATPIYAVLLQRAHTTDEIPLFFSQSMAPLPTELIAALHALAGDRFGPRLTRLARTKRVGRE